ncbi:putative DNA endonuclease SmrA [Fundidesulfovibrio magnetotacticus]|uniref:Putative DNA endonuclease SmrA n=1 Tax=Fundidesulfovibrio magnetotacticus TaxID=2730080 RepID=A0A6V8LWX0_9BACT|nr:Smr/MutS family protein [Fundidesulfovibrio magnetotacticus]GFK94296.1 putative DNA endonuclease SmrA [Fundidesulfovibrio magnetotacticus]
MPKDEFNNPFGALKSLKLKKKDKPKPPPPPKPAPAAEPPADDGDLFAQAMAGVNRMGAEATGRQVVARVRPTVPPPPTDPDAEVRAKLADLVSGKVEFELEFTDEYVQGFVKGMDQKLFRQLKAGHYSPEAHLDLHGLNADQAYEGLLHFMRDAYFKGRRTILLIPGRGMNSPGGMPVLKQELKSWLTRDPLKRVVLAFCTAQARHGGAGALYVMLRQRKKTEGKIKWDNWWGE